MKRWFISYARTRQGMTEWTFDCEVIFIHPLLWLKKFERQVGKYSTLHHRLLYWKELTPEEVQIWEGASGEKDDQEGGNQGPGTPAGILDW